MCFYDRKHAGEQLGKILARKYAGENIVVYALPRGGVITGKEIAKALHAPLDLIITRKIGHPYQPEYAIAATAENGHIVGNEKELARVNKTWLQQAVRKEQQEAKRRHKKYLGLKKAIPVEGKIAVLVDDGIATGLTMKIAIIELKHKHPKKIVVSVPVAPKEVTESIKKEVDDFVALEIPQEYEFLGSIGAYYQEFSPVEDKEVISTMEAYEKEFGKISSQKQYKPLIRTDPMLFTFPQFEYIAKDLSMLPNLTTGKFSLEQFSNDELYIRLHSHAAERECFILGTLAPPEVNLLSFLFLAQTLQKEHAWKITAILPYLAYSRHDKKEPLKSQATALLGQLLSAAGIHEVITIDVHSPHVKQLFPIPLISISTAEIFASEIKKLHAQNATLVAPDEGAVKRCKAVAKALDADQNIVYMVKERTAKGIKHTDMHGKAGLKAIVIDDILDTGATLISCCQTLVEKGVKQIIIMVTHGQFTGEEWKKLWKLHVEKIYITDTIPVKTQHKKNIHVLSIIPLLFSEIKKESKGLFTIKATQPYDFYEYDNA